MSNLIPQIRSIKPTLVSTTLQTLMSASLHLGHSKSAWNPNMISYIYGHRNGIHIINLEETLVHLRRACLVAKEVSKAGGNVLFVGTRKRLHPLVEKVARENNCFFTTNWQKGLVLNKERTLRRSVGYDPEKVVQTMKQLVFRDESDPIIDKDPKQPVVATPDLVILLDFPNTTHAVTEFVAVCDTDCDPSVVQYPIPANDDAMSGIELIANVLGAACKDGYEEWVALQSETFSASSSSRDHEKFACFLHFRYLPKQRSRNRSQSEHTDSGEVESAFSRW